MAVPPGQICLSDGQYNEDSLLLQLHGPVRMVEELPPGTVPLVAQVNVKQRAVPGLDRLVNDGLLRVAEYEGRRFYLRAIR